MLKDKKLIAHKKALIFDGANGTCLLSEGVKPGESPSIMNLRNPEAVYQLHKAYVDAGSEIITTNTFSANQENFTFPQLDKVISAGIKIARQALGKNRNTILVADVAPIGKLMTPYGKLAFEQAVRNYCDLFAIYKRNNIETVFIETFTSLVEAKVAFLAARGYFKKIWVSIALEDSGYTIMGDSPESFALLFDRLGAAALGINCSTPEAVIMGIRKMRPWTSLPLIAKPNAGKVSIIGSTVRHSLNDQHLAGYYKRFVDAGADIIGGCCGTKPEYIKIIARKKYPVKKIHMKKMFALCSSRRISGYDRHDRPWVVGERLNPSGRSKLRAMIADCDFRMYGDDARKQEEAGASALDVNAFVAGHDEKRDLSNAVLSVSANSTLPLFIDTQDYDAAQALLSRYPGIGVYNSIPAREKDLKKWLLMVKGYGFKAVISLVGKKIPKTARERVQNIKIALKVARQIDFDQDDLIFDPLVFSLATDKEQVRHTLDTIEILRKKKLRSIIGISNISYGLPERSWLNASLVSAAVKSGIDFIIANPLDENVMASLRAARALHKGDVLSFVKDIEKAAISSKKTVQSLVKPPNALVSAIITGDAKTSNSVSTSMLKSGIKPDTVINKHIIKALEIVGDRYEKGLFFVPDLLRSADAAKAALSIVKRFMPQKRSDHKILLATVKGDIHDIGKNIAAMVFESAGFCVIDLGKNVSAEKIVQAVKKYHPCVVGLSALLTTTMPEMAHVIKELDKNKCNVKVIIGGPNVTASYAKQIGAYGSARSALEGLGLVRNVIKKK